MPQQVIHPQDTVPPDKLETFGFDWDGLRDNVLVASHMNNNDRTEGTSSWLGRRGPPPNLTEVCVDPPPGLLTHAQEASLMAYMSPLFLAQATPQALVQHWTTALAFCRQMRPNDF